MEDRIKNLKNGYDNIPIPDEALNSIKSGIARASAEQKTTPIHLYRKIALSAAAAFAICILSVNSSATVANAMGGIPVLGRFFKVITIRNYSYEHDRVEVAAIVPKIQENNSDAVDNVNRDASEYIEDLVAQFEDDCADYEGGYQSLDVSYDVVTDSPDYFCLDISAVDTAASGYEFHNYYCIDKRLDKVVTLSDIFGAGSNYIDVISDEIIHQMKADPDAGYFIGEQEEGFEGFTKINDNQNFYVDDDGKIVICFEEYEVGPGSIGSPQFTIPIAVTKSIK